MPRQKSKLETITYSHCVILALCTGDGRRPDDLFKVCKAELDMSHTPRMATELMGAGYLKYQDARLQATEKATKMLDAFERQATPLLKELKLLASLSDAAGVDVRVILRYASEIQSQT